MQFSCQLWHKTLKKVIIMGYSINANIQGWVDWLTFYTKEKQIGLSEYKKIEIYIEDLTTEQLRDIVKNHDFSLIHTTIELGYNDTDIESKIVYTVLRDKAEHDAYALGCNRAYKYWVIKINKALKRKPEYRQGVKDYLSHHGLTYPELEL